MKNYTIIAFSKNTPGILYRISDLFLKRKINIESLTVSETERHEISRFTIVVHTDETTVEKIVKQLYRIIEITKVFESEDKDLLYKELAFFKVATNNPEKRREVEELAYLYRAKVVHVGTNYLVIEKTGTEEETNSLFLLLKPFGIKEFVRTGRIALTKTTQVSTKTAKAHGSPPKNPSQVASVIDVSMIKRIELMAKNYQDVISLAQGIPSFATPKHISDAAKKAIDEHKVDKYTPGFGIPQLRKVIVKKIARDNGIKVQVDNIVVTHGAIEGLMAIFMALFNPDDEVIVPSPDYASHITQIRIARHGGKPIFVPMSENGSWNLDADKIESAVTNKTKGILICNPSNPTGKIYTREELKKIAQIAIKHNLYIITDEMYEYFVYDNRKHISIGSFPEVVDRVISVFGVSKSYAMTGWRIGYIAGPQKVIQNIFKVHDSLVTCPTAVSQYAALAALTDKNKNTVNYFMKEFTTRRTIILKELKKSPKISLTVPQGAYYAFPKIQGLHDDYEFAVELIRNAGVAVVPGSAFGPGGEGHIRISFGGAEENLKKGLSRLVKYINKTSIDY